MSTFKVGDSVTWTSQAQGTAKEKTGSVIAVIPRGVAPREVPGIDWHSYAFDSFGLWGRSRESYLIAVPQGIAAKPRLYWPKESLLRLAGKTEVQQLRECIAELLKIIDALADQQAMPDDTYRKRLDELRKQGLLP